MPAFEKLGVFYLGKKTNPQSGELSPEYLLYESKDLCTHAMCVGMTGSGKTGLCIGLLEEAAIDNIPAIIIDPKGDLGNLLLAFPELRPDDFLPWINTDEARQKGVSAEEFAREQAELWKNGLGEWEQDSERIRLFKQAADFAIYTPGSSAGLPVSIVQSFAAPSAKAMEDLDLLRERIQTTASGLLELLGIKADPLQSREHILLSNVIEHSWMAGKDLDLGELIRMIQTPPVTRIGVFDVESFYPATERFKLSMTLNNLLAAPGFKTWMEGEALDIDRMLYTANGKPRTSIFSIAHLSDSERMFFVTLLLNQVLGWMRAQPGTTSLRALLYMDEVFGFLPPIGEPPSKKPLLTLLKQARAFGLGVVLATQNPVDLDYKGLSNIGTWFIGRLQTERDKERLADGLTSASAQTAGWDVSTLMNTISNLKKRQFLMQNVHAKQPQLFGTRWAMSYLRGPLTRDQIKLLMKERVAEIPPIAPARPVAASHAAAGGRLSTRPQLPPEIRQYVSPAGKPAAGGKVVYHPYLVAGGDVQIFNNTYGVAQSEQLAHALPMEEGGPGLAWEQAFSFSFEPGILSGQAVEGAEYTSMSSEAAKPSTYNRLDQDYENFVFRNYQLLLWKSASTGQLSRPGEAERDFRIRLSQTGHERRDLEMDRLKRQYASKIATLERQLLAARQQVEREEDQYKQKQMDTAISAGSSLLGMLLGGKKGLKGGVTQAARSATRMSKEKQDVERAQEKAAQLEARLQELQAQLQRDVEKISGQFDPMLETLQQIVLRPKKSDILQRWYGILWVPFLHRDDGTRESLVAQIG